MSNINANVNPEMLIWARNTIKLSIALAADKIGVAADKLESWEKGESSPTIKQLHSISYVYKRPFALFYFPKPPNHFSPLKDFRKFPSQTPILENEEYNLQKELLLFQRKREMAIELYEELDIGINEFQLKGSADESPINLANKISRYLGIDYIEVEKIAPGYDALNFWKNLLESKGVLVFQTTGVPLNVMRGACIAKDQLPVIIINSNDTQNGRIFSLFHELVHIVLREDGISNFRFGNKAVFDKIEVFCNQVAAEVLVPSDLLSNTFVVRLHDSGIEWSFAELKTLANLFCVSQEVILRRLLTLNKTNNIFYQEFRNKYDIIEKKKNSGGDYYRNVIAKNGALYINLALQGYYQNKLTSSALSDFIQVKLSNISKLEKLLHAKV